MYDSGQIDYDGDQGQGFGGGMGGGIDPTEIFSMFFGGGVGLTYFSPLVCGWEWFPK